MMKHGSDWFGNRDSQTVSAYGTSLLSWFQTKAQKINSEILATGFGAKSGC